MAEEKKVKDKVTLDRREFLMKEFANTTPEFVEYGKKILAKKFHFMINGDKIIYLDRDKIAAFDVYKSDEAKMQITVTELLDEKFTFDPFKNESLQLVCNVAKFK